MDKQFDEVSVTIQEWASENELLVTPKQIDELRRGLEAAREMAMYKTGWTLGDKTYLEREQATKIEKLERTVAQLEGFIASKGYRISANENGVTHYMMLPCGPSHWASHDITRDFVKGGPIHA